MKVFLDMDGVLADFGGGVHKVFNIPYSLSDYPYTKGLWDWFVEANLTWDQVDSVCTAKFWADLEWMADGKGIYHAVRRFTRQTDSSLNLLTTPMKNINSTVGKLTWIQEHLGKNRRKQALITGADKKIFAGPDTLLIDDRDKNIEEFIAAGGQGLLVPRPWNIDHHWANETLDIVKRKLEKLQWMTPC